MFRRRRTMRRVARRTARRTSRRLHNIYLDEQDLNKIEKETGKSGEELSEHELLEAMKRWGIKRVELGDEP